MLAIVPGRHVPGAAPGADLSGVGGYGYNVPPGKTLGVRRIISSYAPPGVTLTVRRIVGKLTAPGKTLGIMRSVYYRAITPPGKTLGVRRTVTTQTPPGRTLGVRRAVYDPLAVKRPHQRWIIMLDGTDYTAVTSLDITISASEGQNQTAVFRFRPDLGPLDVDALEGRAVEISRYIDGQLVRLFTGTLTNPVYDYGSRRMVCNCSDLREERLGKESQTHLKQLTGGIYSNIVQQKEAEGRTWVAELMKTVPGTLNYDGAGVLHYAPWATGTPRYTLVNNRVRREALSVDYVQRSQIINSIKINVDYRYDRQRARKIDASVSTTFEAIIAGESRLLPKEALLGAAQSVNNWTLAGYEFEELPGPGYIWVDGQRIPWTPYTRNTATTYENVDGQQVKTGRISSSTDARDTYALGINATLVRHISQPITEQYRLTVTAPESIDRYGLVEGSTQQHAIDSDTDSDAWEDATPGAWPPSGFSLSAANDYIRYADDKRTELATALTAAWRIAQKEILASHRRNTVTYIHKGNPGDSILDVRIGDTIALQTNVVSCTGNVKSYDHRQHTSGHSETQITLALSRISSDVTATTNWSQPSAPSIPEQPRATVGTVKGTADGGIVEITVPEVADVYVDEIEAKRTASYTLAIPRDPLTVNQTAYNE